MRMERGEMRAMPVLLLALGVLLASLCAVGCDRTEPAGETREEEREVAEVVEPRPQAATLTLYFRESDGEDEWLRAEERTLPEVADACRAALEELIAGPAPGSGLFAVLPPTVRVLDVKVAGGVCTANVSGEILSDAAAFGVSALGEELALAAIANTLTELDGVTRVKLLVEGTQSGMVGGRPIEDFWGHMGLPEYLERDPSLIR